MMYKSLLPLAIAMILLQSCGANNEDSSVLDSSLQNHVFWEEDRTIGDKDRFSVRVHPVIKNSGEKANRKTITRFSVDGWVFDYKLPKNKEGEGQLIDLAAIINRGELSSYSYVRVLGDTKWEHHSAQPKLTEKFTQNVKGKVEYPVLLGGLAGDINVEGTLTGVLSANMKITSPDERQVKAEFNPHIGATAGAAAIAKSNFWATADVTGQVKLVDYGFNSYLEASYDPSRHILDSSLNVKDHKLQGLGGKVTVNAELGPDSDADILSKGLWSLMNGDSKSKKYQHVVYEQDAATVKEFETITMRSNVELPEFEEEPAEVDCSADYLDLIEEANASSDLDERESLMDRAVEVMIHCI